MQVMTAAPGIEWVTDSTVQPVLQYTLLLLHREMRRPIAAELQPCNERDRQPNQLDKEADCSQPRWGFHWIEECSLEWRGSEQQV